MGQVPGPSTVAGLSRPQLSSQPPSAVAGTADRAPLPPSTTAPPRTTAAERQQLRPSATAGERNCRRGPLQPSATASEHNCQRPQLPPSPAAAEPSCRRAQLPAGAHKYDLSMLGIPCDTEHTTHFIIYTLHSLQPHYIVAESAAGLTESDQISMALSDKYYITIMEMAFGRWWRQSTASQRLTHAAQSRATSERSGSSVLRSSVLTSCITAYDRSMHTTDPCIRQLCKFPHRNSQAPAQHLPETITTAHLPAAKDIGSTARRKPYRANLDTASQPHREPSQPSP